MSFKKAAAMIFWVFLCCGSLKAQVENDQIIEVIIESVTENVGEDFDFTELTERLNFYRKNPINLNKTGREPLQELMFLSPLQISALMVHRDENGKLLELYELQSIDGFDLETIRKLLPFVSIGEVNPLSDISFKNLINKGENDVIFTFSQIIEKQHGYLKSSDDTNSTYKGTPLRFLTRYRYHFGRHLSASLTMEKDAGEGFFSGSQQRGFDFYSGSIFFKNDGTVKKVALGDYSLQFGQGLSLWSGLSFGKGAAIATVAKNEIGLKPYTSTNEALFLRGAAATINIKKIEFTPFVSYRPLDAGLNINQETAEEEVSSLSQTGLHRTTNEISNKNSISQLIYGGNVQYSGKSLRLGSLFYHTGFNKPFEKGKQLYNAYDFADRSLSNVAAYYNYNWRNIYLFGEAAHSLGSGSAFLNGAMASLTPKVSLLVFNRSYQKDYHSFFNQAIAESSNAINEKGFYSGIVISPSRKYEFSAYADFFRFPWLKFRVDAPSTGYEILSQFTYSPSKRLKTILRYKFEQKEENDELENAINFLEQVKKQNYRLELSYKVNDVFSIRNRAEVVSHQKAEANKEFGFLLFQDVNYNPLQSKFSGNLRFAVFDTDSFNARIYAYENDVLYGFSAPAYQNKGLRFYANGRYRINRKVDAWLRYAISSYSNRDEVGSGLDKIQGSNKSDIKIQIRFQF